MSLSFRSSPHHMLKAFLRNIFLTFYPFLSLKIHLGLSISHCGPYRHEFIKVSPIHIAFSADIRLCCLSIRPWGCHTDQKSYACTFWQDIHVISAMGENSYQWEWYRQGEVSSNGSCLTDQCVRRLIGQTKGFRGGVLLIFSCLTD